MKRKNYFVLLLLAIITLSVSSCIVIDNPEDQLVTNTPAALSGKRWVETYPGTDKVGPYSCEHTIYFDLNGTGYEIFKYRAVDKYGNVDYANPYLIESGIDNPKFRFQWTVISAELNHYMTIVLTNPGWEGTILFKDMQVKRSTLTGLFDGEEALFYNKGF